jgi:hypothetical protein
MQTSEMTHCEAEPSLVSRRVPAMVLGERILLALLLLLFVGRALMPAWRHVGSDFANYYLVACLYRDGYPVERVYEWTWLQRQKDYAGMDQSLVGFAPFTLTSSLLVAPVSSLSMLHASRVWLAMSLALLSLTAALLRKITAVPWRSIGLILFLAVAPLHSNFLLGQVHVVMLFLLALAAWLYFTDRPFLSALVIAIASALKIHAALFFVFFLLKRQWRAAAGLLFGVAGTILLSIWLFGLDACRIYFREVLPWGLRGEIIDPYGIGWDSLNSLFRRLFIFEPELNPAPVAHLPYLYAFLHSVTPAVILVLFLWAIAIKSRVRTRLKLEWASFCFLLLLLSPEPFPYHFVVLIVVAALVVDHLISAGQSGWARLLLVLYGLACIPYDRLYRMNPRGWFSLLVFPRLYWMLLIAGVLLYLLVTSEGDSLRSCLRKRSFVYATIACVGISVAGFVMDLRHLQGQFDNYSTRIATTVGSAIAVDPVVTADSVLYGALAPTFTSAHDRYVVHQLKENSIIGCGGGGDWFHPTATMEGHTTLAEVAVLYHSSIIQFEPLGCVQSSPPPSAEIAVGQQPVLSTDGRNLAYIREIQGRGSLFISLVRHLPDQPSAERQLAGPQYDVREAAFSPEGEIIFSSWQRHRYYLYSVELESNDLAQVTGVNCSARYPAFSPNGDWLAFSCERGGVWQIVVKDRRTGELHQLTNADCNSVTPAWTPDSRSLIYATDCGRALGITALSKLRVVQ